MHQRLPLRIYTTHTYDSPAAPQGLRRDPVAISAEQPKAYANRGCGATAGSPARCLSRSSAPKRATRGPEAEDGNLQIDLVTAESIRFVARP